MGSGDVLDEVNSVGELLNLLVSFRTYELLLFRGQREPCPLLPKIGRPIKPRVKNAPIPDLEQSMLKEFRWRALPHMHRSLGDNLWEWLALAQHYGMPTRLLDWTTNPLAALWFAVREAPKSEKPGIVWLFEPQEEDHEDRFEDSPFEVKTTQVFRPTHITPRIIVQSGWFTVHRWIPEEKIFKPLESDAKYKGKILRIYVPMASFGRIREELARLEIHSASMFPDLDGLGSHVKWLHIRNKDE